MKIIMTASIPEKGLLAGQMYDLSLEEAAEIIDNEMGFSPEVPIIEDETEEKPIKKVKK